MNYLSYKTNSNVNPSFCHSKNKCARTSDVKVTLCYYYTEPLYLALPMTSEQFLALSNSTLKVESGKNYSKIGIILKVNNEVVVEI